MRYALLSVILFAGAVSAETAETFRCQAGAFWNANGKIVVIATINKDGSTGTIQVAGVTHRASYQVQGFERRWDFDMQDDYTYDYAFVLKPSGIAHYSEFSGAEAGEKVSSSSIFICR